MSEITVDNESRPNPRPRRLSAELVVLPPLIFLALMFLAAGTIAIALGPLKALDIPYPRVLDYAHVLVPLACAVLWLATLRRWPRVGPVVAVLLCSVLVPQVARYADGRVARVPVRRWMDSRELEAVQVMAGFAMTGQGTRDGTFVIVAPQHEGRAREVLDRIGLLRGEGE